MQLSQIVGRVGKEATGPLYLQLRQRLRDAIEDGLLKPDQALPSERALCEDFDLSRITVRRALNGLVDEHRLVRRHGAGTFIAGGRQPGSQTRVEKVFSKLSSFSEDMASRGMQPSSEWLSKATGMVTPEEAMSLGLSPGSAVHRLRRLRFADGRPMAIEATLVPGAYLASVEDITTSLYEALARTGHRPTRALQRLRAVSFDEEQASIMGIDTGHAGLLIERRSFLPDGRPVEITHSHYRGDAYDFVAELSDV